MRLDALLAAPRDADSACRHEVLGASRSPRSPTTPRAVHRERCSAACPGAHVDGHDHAGAAVEAGAVAAALRAPVGLGVPELWCRRCGPPWARRRRVPRSTRRDARRGRRHRHQRQDHHDATCSRPIARGAGLADRRDRHADRAPHHARGARPAGHAGRVRDARARRGRHGGVVPRARAAPRRRHPLRRRRVHQPRQDHLDFHATMEDYFEAKARLFEPELRDGRRGEPRRPARAPAARRRRGPDASATRSPTSTTSRCGPTARALHVAGRTRRPPAGRPLQRVQRPRRGHGRRRRSASTPAHRRGPGRGAAGARPLRAVDAGQPFRGARRLRPHARRLDAGARRRPRAAGGRPGRSSCSAAAATGTRRSARWARWRPAWPIGSSSPPTTRAARTRWPSSRTSVRASADDDAACIVEPDRRRRDRARARRGRPGDVVLIAGKGHETTQAIGDRGRARSTTARSPARSWRPAEDGAG